jgi:hypothetical protein
MDYSFQPGTTRFIFRAQAKYFFPEGDPVFPGVPIRSPEEILASHGMRPGPTEVLDPGYELTLVKWERKPNLGSTAGDRTKSARVKPS